MARGLGRSPRSWATAPRRPRPSRQRRADCSSGRAAADRRPSVRSGPGAPPARVRGRAQVAPDRRRVDLRRFTIGERREPSQRLVRPSDRGQGHAQHQVGKPVLVPFAGVNARDGFFRGPDPRVVIVFGPVGEEAISARWASVTRLRNRGSRIAASTSAMRASRPLSMRPTRTPGGAPGAPAPPPSESGAARRPPLASPHARTPRSVATR